MANTTALARKFRVDVTSDLTLAGGWTELKGIYALKPTVEPNMVETSSYDTADGWDSFELTGNSWGVTASFYRRTNSGVYDPGQELARACVGQSGDGARIGIRVYDRDGGDEAFEGVAIVTWERANDGVKDVDAATVTFQGDGARTDISNPGTASSVPVITSVSPATGAAAGGTLVTISGSGFTGTVSTTGVKFGGTNATSFNVINDSLISAVTPAHSAGAVDVLVTNGVGPSTTGTGAYTYA